MFLRFHSNIPVSKIINIFLFQFPYVLGQFSVLFTTFISKRTITIIVTFFESIFTNTVVIFISSCTYRCFVNKAFRKRQLPSIGQPVFGWQLQVLVVDGPDHNTIEVLLIARKGESLCIYIYIQTTICLFLIALQSLLVRTVYEIKELMKQLTKIEIF